MESKEDLLFSTTTPASFSKRDVLSTIPCCIVDDHCDIVPFLHALWKAKYIQFDNLALLHVDSHPDLAVPDCSVTEMHDKDLLYDLLEECGGISEFILPLVVNNHFGQGITWLHQPWADQIPVGVTSFKIGDNNESRSGVSSYAAYYLDDGLSYAEHELSHCVDISLLSCHDDYFEHEASGCHDSAGDRRTDNDGWILDICLDYFTVSNPHLKVVQESLDAHGGPFELVHVIRDMFNTVRFRSFPFSNREDNSKGAQYSLQQSRCEREQFFNVLEIILSSDVTSSAHRSAFLALFDDISGPECRTEKEEYVHPAMRFLQLLSETPMKVKDILRGIGLTMIATLPHHASSWTEIEVLMKKLKHFLCKWTINRGGRPPEAICIARSDGDGFTESNLASSIQRLLLDTLQEVNHEYWSQGSPLRRIEVHNIVTDPFIKANALFRNECVLKEYNLQDLHQSSSVPNALSNCASALKKRKLE